jgi:glucan phosphorylase
MVSALPIYSGGLGNVAGDQLKAASDLGVPVVGVGPLYQQGYFRQVIDKDGAQQAIHGSGQVDGVSRLHSKVSRHIFLPLFPHWPEDEVQVLREQRRLTPGF